MSEPSLAFLFDDDLQDKLSTCDLPESLEYFFYLSVWIMHQHQDQNFTLPLNVSLYAWPWILKHPYYIGGTHAVRKDSPDLCGTQTMFPK